MKKVFLKIFRKTPVNPAQVFSWKCFKDFKSTSFIEHLRGTASGSNNSGQLSTVSFSLMTRTGVRQKLIQGTIYNIYDGAF